ncbi:MAG: VTT domain-containing protein [Promethearchaeota archaeon]
MSESNSINNGKNAEKDKEAPQEKIEEVLKETKTFLERWGGIILIIGIIIFFVILGFLNINFGQWMANSMMYFYNKYGWFGIYLGVFVISIFGNFTVIFPVPYTIALIVISAVVPGVNPILLGLVAGLGAAIGEVSAYYIGRGSQALLKDKDSIVRMHSYVDRGWAPILIFIFAATPLPDDAFLIVLGIARYSIVKTLIWCYLGKFVLCALVSALPIWLVNTSIGDTLFSLFGINLEAAKQGIIPPNSTADIIRSSVMWAATLIIMFLFVYVDWEKVFKRKKDKYHPDKVLNGGSNIGNLFMGFTPKFLDRFLKFLKRY